MTDRIAILWRKPRHHEDHQETQHGVAWVELFYDLIHVVAVFVLGDLLAHHLGFGTFAVFALVFVAIWMAWADTVFYTSLFVADDVVHRLLVTAQICTVMVFAVSVPHVAEGELGSFLAALAVNRALIAAMYWRAWRHAERGRAVAQASMRNFALAAAALALAAALPTAAAAALAIAAALVLQWAYVAPGWGVMRDPAFTAKLDHLAERMSLLVLIVIGEGFFKLVLTAIEEDLSAMEALAILPNFFAGALILFVVCWSYFDFVGQASPRRDARNTTIWWYGHLVLMLACVMIGVGVKGEAAVTGHEAYPFAVAFLGWVGATVFLLCLGVLERAIEPQPLHAFYGWRLRLFGIALITLVFAFDRALPSALGNLLVLIGLGAQVAYPILHARSAQ